MSARQIDQLQRPCSFERRAYWVHELPVQTAGTIESSKMNPLHDHLNELLDEKPHAPLDAPESGQTERVVFLTGRIAMPDDFDQMGEAEIEKLFDDDP